MAHKAMLVQLLMRVRSMRFVEAVVTFPRDLSSPGDLYMFDAAVRLTAWDALIAMANNINELIEIQAHHRDGAA